MMTNPNGQTALQVNGEEIGWRQVLCYAQFWDRAELLQSVADAVLIRQAADKQEIVVCNEELQQTADQFRAARGLLSAEQTMRWLEARYLTSEEWESLLETEVITRKLRQALTQSKIEHYFASNRLSFDAVELSHLVVRESDVARELRTQIIEEAADFHALARRHSIDSTSRSAGGYLGLVRRNQLTAPAQAAVFGAQAGEVVGPVKCDQGWKLIKVEALRSAKLDDAMRNEIETLLFNEWLGLQRHEAQITMPLLNGTSNEGGELE